MKILRILSLSIIFVCLLGLAGVEAALVPENSGRLEVTGNAVITAAPDIARITLGVETSNTSADKAAAENADRMASVLEALKNLGLSNAEISTSGYNIYSYSDPYQRTATDEAIVTTYNVHNRINITTKNLEQVGKIVDVAVKAGANQVQGVSFDLADKQELQLQALDVAIKQAVSKAEVMAASAGVTLAGIVSVNEEYGTYVPRNESMLMRGAAYDLSAETSINPGEIEVSVQVTMVFWF